MRQASILFIGGGNMTHSLVSGLIKDDYNPNRIWVVDHNQEKLALLSQQFQVNTSANLNLDLPSVDIVVLAIKPQSLAALPKAWGSILTEKKPLIISIIAGIKLDNLSEYFGKKTPIVRAMPNTPALIQCGATGLFANDNTSVSQKSQVEHILRSVGVVAWVNAETKLDIITALSAGGPAYYFFFMEIMSELAIELGLDEKTAHLFTIQTALGAAKLALESPDELSVLRQNVTSKGGTTHATIKSFEKEGIRELLKKGFVANITRSKELAEHFAQQTKLIDKTES